MEPDGEFISSLIIYAKLINLLRCFPNSGLGNDVREAHASCHFLTSGMLLEAGAWEPVDGCIFMEK